MNKSIRLLIASDDLSLRIALVMFFGSQEGFEVVGEATNPVEARTLCALLKPDVLLLDPNIQRKDTITFIGSLCQDHTNTKVVILSFNSNGVTAEQVLQVGAVKYFNPSISIFDMAVAIRQIHTLA